MSEGGDEPRKIKVVDRRRFDESGDLRPDRPRPEKRPEPPKPASPEPDRPGEPIAGEPSPVGQQPEPGVGGRADTASGERATSPLFMELIAALAQQAEILISGGQGLPAQPAEAQRMIDYLGVLESKTRGNLSAEEQQILSNVIFQLRTLYVQQTK